MKIVFGHQVGVEVVVHQGVVFVRPGYAVQAEGAAPLGIEGAKVPEKPGRLENHFGPALFEKGKIAGGVEIPADREGDVGVNVILRGAGRVIGGSFRAANGAPWEKRPFEMELPRSRAGAVEGVMPVAQQGPGNFGLRVDEEGRSKNLRVPEIMALVAVPAQAFRGHAAPAVRARGLQEVKQAEPEPEIHGRIALDLHVRLVPERRQGCGMLLQ